MLNEEVLKRFKENFDERDFSVSEPSDMLTLIVSSSKIHEAVAFLKKEVGFEFLTDLCGIHYPEKELQLGVIYHLHNLQQNIRIRLKTFVPVSDPKVPTLTDLFAGANWMERETFDFFGIQFVGHPNLKRILNVDYLDYHPLRKEYPLEDPTREDKDDRFFGR
jgi:NADH-quinone oxidoreductase subunit C